MEFKKAVIPAAGWGTRMLPVSKVVPKELLPILNRPMIHYAVQEAIAAGIEELVIVVSSAKQAIIEYFTAAPDLERWLTSRGDVELLSEWHYIASRVKFNYVFQEQQLGLGHALLTARDAIGDDPFAVLLPDDIIFSSFPAIGQLITAAKTHDCSTISVETISGDRLTSYGVIRPEETSPGVFRVLGLVEKPKLEEAPSDLAIVGRYVFTPEIFDALEQLQPRNGEEIQLPDAIQLLLANQDVFAYHIVGTRIDVGNPLGLLQAGIRIALEQNKDQRSFLNWIFNELDKYRI